MVLKGVKNPLFSWKLQISLLYNEIKSIGLLHLSGYKLLPA